MTAQEPWAMFFAVSVIVLAIYDVHDRRGDVIFWGLMVMVTGIFMLVTA